MEFSGTDSDQLVKVTRPTRNLTTLFYEMYKQGKFVDVTLSCNSLQVKAHRLVLSACSPYFNHLFEKVAIPLHHPIVVLKDMPPEDLRLIVEFMYLGEIRITQRKLLSLIKHAESLHISGLSTIESNDSQTTWKEYSPPSSEASNSSNDEEIDEEEEEYVGAEDEDDDIDEGMNEGEDDEGSLDRSQKQLLAQPNKNFNIYHQQTEQNIKPNDLNMYNSMSEVNSQGTHSFQILENEMHISNNRSINSDSWALTSDHQADDEDSIKMLEHPFMTVGDSAVTSELSKKQNGFSSSGIKKSEIVSSQQQFEAELKNRMQSSKQKNVSISADNLKHQCNICLRSFKEKANLKRHSQVHTKNRPKYACPECDKLFNWRANLIRHLNSSSHKPQIENKRVL